MGSKLCAKKLRELCALCERKECPLREKKLPTTPIGSLVGVTSHITPLPTGEGKGEGPAGEGGGATVSSVREKYVLCEKGKVFRQTENVRIFHNSYPSLFEETLFLNEEEALQHSRTCFSWSKNMPLLMQEGHVLKRCL